MCVYNYIIASCAKVKIHSEKASSLDSDSDSCRESSDDLSHGFSHGFSLRFLNITLEETFKTMWKIHGFSWFI